MEKSFSTNETVKGGLKVCSIYIDDAYNWLGYFNKLFNLKSKKSDDTIKTII